MNAASAIYTVNKVFNGHTYTINLDTTQINVDMIFTPMHDVEFPIVNVGDPEPDDVEHWSFNGPKKASQFSGLQRAEGVVKLILTGKDEYTVADIDAAYPKLIDPKYTFEVKVDGVDMTDCGVVDMGNRDFSTSLILRDIDKDHVIDVDMVFTMCRKMWLSTLTIMARYKVRCIMW